ncbi:MAG: hypothetical protein V1781_09910 [Bacteroidota bacterium]
MYKSIIFNKINISAHIRFLFSVYLNGILFFTLLRFILLCTKADTLPKEDYGFLFTSFVFGFRFDTCVSCYILSLPFLLLFIGFLFHQIRKIFFALSYYFILVFYCIAFFICCADIPYYNYFSSRITTASLLWIDSPVFMLKMIFGEFTYWIYFILFFLIIFLFVRRMNKTKSKIMTKYFHQTNNFSWKNGIIFFVFAGLLFLGIRGRISEKSPIRTGTAYFCNNNFLNQLGLNGAFTFITSVIEDSKAENQQLNLMNDEEAITYAKKKS